ncbi:unnamed protein product [Diatraea saccharalis]|uniref:Uncharacterized protein n=1 Tax=Diatraea saccharalis TaxID=40085 RepID=A0A9N9WCC0_9NEOP|nr:unnamed protein product [Diatraea saccharalis]
MPQRRSFSKVKYNMSYRRYAAMRKRRMARKMKNADSESQFTTLGVTDGKPRARNIQKRVKDDDSVCGLDEIPRPEHVQIPANLKRGTLQTHSLTVLPCTKERKPDVHYGILTGSFNMYDAKFGELLLSELDSLLYSGAFLDTRLFRASDILNQYKILCI